MHGSHRRSAAVPNLNKPVDAKGDAMFSHVMIGTDDLEASKKFYDAVLGTLGISPGFIDDNRRIFYMSPTGAFTVTKTIKGDPATTAQGGYVGLAGEGPA